MVVIPAVLHYPATEQFCVLLRSLPETVHLTVSLEMKLKNHTLLEKDVEAPGLYQCFEFQVCRSKWGGGGGGEKDRDRARPHEDSKAWKDQGGKAGVLQAGPSLHIACLGLECMG